MIFKKDIFNELQIIGYIDKSLILFKQNSECSCIFALDQHAAHERILFESLLESWMMTNPSAERIVPMSYPLKNGLGLNFSLTLANENISVLIEDLKSFGLTTFLSDERNLTITGFPILIKPNSVLSSNFVELVSKFVEKRIEYIIGQHMKEDLGKEFLNAAVTTLLQTKACKSAIRFGDPLTRAEQYKLIEKLKNCSQPFRCAHGRPLIAKICTEFSREQCS